jgi:hypothetical protein
MIFCACSKLVPYLALGFFFLKKKKKGKSCHVDKGGHELCLELAMYHIFTGK